MSTRDPQQVSWFVFNGVILCGVGVWLLATTTMIGGIVLLAVAALMFVAAWKS